MAAPIVFKLVWSRPCVLLLCLSLGVPQGGFCPSRTLLGPTEVPSGPNGPKCSAHPRAMEQSACLGWPAHPAHVPDGQASAEPSGLGSRSINLERLAREKPWDPNKTRTPPRVLTWLLEQETAGHPGVRGEERAV